MPAEWLVLLPLAPLAAGIVLELALARALGSRGKGWLALGAGAASLGGVVAAWPAILAGRSLDAVFGAWDGPARLAYHVDGLGFLFAFMAAGIGAAVLLYSVEYFAREKAATRFYALLLLFIAGLIHLVYTADLFLLYASWEVIGICSFLLVGFWYAQPEAARGARKVLTMTHLAGYGLLAAAVVLFSRTGSTLWTDPGTRSAFTTGVFVLVLVAALAKSVQFPLHTWIPDAMAAPTPVSALLHAACYVKAGVYLVARLHSIGPWPAAWGGGLAWVGALTLIVGALFMLTQRDLKRLLAFSTVSQIGYMMVGLGLGTPLGIAAGLLHCLNHGLFKGGLFLCAGAIQQACGTRDMDRLGGLAPRMPRTTAVWIVCAAGVAGVPLLNGFASKWLLYAAALEANQPLLALVPWLGSVLTVFAFLRATSGVFLGTDGESTGGAREAAWPMVTGGAVLAAGCVLTGVLPQAAIAGLINPLLPALGRPALQGVTWFGLTAGQGAWFATAGFALGLVALVIGALVYVASRVGRIEAPAGSSYVRSASRGIKAAGGSSYAGAGFPVPSVFTGGEPLGPLGHLGASDFSRIVGDSLAPFYRAFDADRAWLAVWRAASGGAQAGARWLRAAERVPAVLPAALAPAAVLAAYFVPGGAPGLRETVPMPATSLSPLAVALFMALGGLLLACLAVHARPLQTALLGLAGLLACGATLVDAPVTRSLLFESASAVALVVLWTTTGHARGRAEPGANRAEALAPARRAYLAAIVLSAIGVVGGGAAIDRGQAAFAFALLLPAMAIKLGLVPFWLWLPLVAEAAPALLTGVVVAVVDVAALGEMISWRLTEGWLFHPGWPWIAAGIASAAAGAVLSLAQRDVKRLLAFSTVQDMGLLTVSLTLGGRYGVSGAVIGGAVHALAKALLFASIAAPEAEGERLVDARGLASRHPVAAAGFLVGALSITGVPATLGYAAHWRTLAAAASQPWLLAAVVSAGMVSVAVYARAITLFWWGPPLPGADAPGYSRPMLAAAIVGLALALVGAGVWPGLLGGGA